MTPERIQAIATWTPESEQAAPTWQEAMFLAQLALTLAAEVDDSRTTLAAAWVDGYVERSLPGRVSPTVISEAYRKVASMPTAHELLAIYGDPRKPGPRGILTGSAIPDEKRNRP